MLVVNIKFCVVNFSTGIPFKILFVIKKDFVFHKKCRRIRNSRIFSSNSQAMIFITYTLLKCLPNKTMQLILYDDGHFTCSAKVQAISFV